MVRGGFPNAWFMRSPDRGVECPTGWKEEQERHCEYDCPPHGQRTSLADNRAGGIKPTGLLAEDVSGWSHRARCPKRPPMRAFWPDIK